MMMMHLQMRYDDVDGRDNDDDDVGGGDDSNDGAVADDACYR